MAQNLSITLRSVGKRKANIIQDKIHKIMDLYNIKSAGFRLDYFDVNDDFTHIHNINEKKYINQYDDHSCKLITLLNAYIYKYDKRPIEYKSDDFYDLVEDCCGSHTSPIIYIEVADIKLNIKRVQFKGSTIEGLKRFCINKLKDNKGYMIDFSLVRKNCLHSCLLVEYYFDTKAFKTINSKCLQSKNPVEYLTWEILTKHAKGRDANDCMNGTNAIKIQQKNYE